MAPRGFVTAMSSADAQLRTDLSKVRGVSQIHAKGQGIRRPGPGEGGKIIAIKLYEPYSPLMKDNPPVPQQLGSEDARNDLPRLLYEAERGRATVITRRGRAVAALVPLEAMTAPVRQQPLSDVLGSGKGLWGRDSRAGLRKLRDEWNR